MVIYCIIKNLVHVSEALGMETFSLLKICVHIAKCLTALSKPKSEPNMNVLFPMKAVSCSIFKILYQSCRRKTKCSSFLPTVCVCVCVHLVDHLCLILHDPVDYIARQAPLSLEFPRQEYWSGLPFPSPVDLPDTGIKPISLVSRLLHYRADSLPLHHLGSPLLPTTQYHFSFYQTCFTLLT